MFRAISEIVSNSLPITSQNLFNFFFVNFKSATQTKIIKSTSLTENTPKT